MITPENIVAEARTWLGTPFHHQARVKGKGCDCLGLIMGVAKELGLKDKHGVPIASYDIVTYRRLPNAAYLIQKLESALNEVPVAEARAGDLGLFMVEGNAQHLGILSDCGSNSSNSSDTSNKLSALGVIHSDARSQKVVEHRLDLDWQSRLVKTFRLI